MAFRRTLTTNVNAKTKNFRKGMKDSRTSLQKFVGSAKRMGMGVTKLGGILTGVAVGALVLFTKNAFKAIDATAKLASELEISTEKLLGYQMAAGLSGTDTATLNKSLQKMAKIVGEAKLGVTTGTKALEDFGISLRELRGLSTDQVFELFADRIGKIKDPMERSAKAALIFGKSGQKLVNFMAMGKEGLAEVRKEVERLGLSFSAVDAKKVEQANDAMLKMETVLKGIGNQFAVAIAPKIESVTNKTLKWIEGAGGIDTVINKGITETKAVLKKLGTQIEKVHDLYVNFFKISTKFDLNLNPPLNPDDVKKTTDKVSTTLDDFLNKFDNQRVKKAGDSIKNGLGGALDSVSDKFKSSMDEFMKAVDDAAKKQKEKLMSMGEGIFEQTRTPIEKITAEIENLKKVSKAGGLDLFGGEDTFKRRMDQLNAEMKEAMKFDMVEAGQTKRRQAFLEGKDKEKPKFEALKGQQIDLKNLAFLGRKGPQDVGKEQLGEQKKSNGLLADIANSVKKGSVAVAG